MSIMEGKRLSVGSSGGGVLPSDDKGEPASAEPITYQTRKPRCGARTPKGEPVPVAAGNGKAPL